jgi:hypothetical protein
MPTHIKVTFILGIAIGMILLMSVQEAFAILNLCHK